MAFVISVYTKRDARTTLNSHVFAKKNCEDTNFLNSISGSQYLQ